MGWLCMVFNQTRDLRVNKESLNNIDKQLKSAFSTVKEEMEEHLQSINENTSELQQNSDHLIELENKINKLEQRMGEIHLMLGKIVNTTKVSVDLTLEEQKVFLILYTNDSFLSAEQPIPRAVWGMNDQWEFG